MDAKELHYELRGGGRMWVEGASEDEEETILRALSLLAAAEANDGTTPETDNPNNIDSWRATKDRSRSLERERNGLAAEVLRLKTMLHNNIPWVKDCK